MPNQYENLDFIQDALLEVGANSMVGDNISRSRKRKVYLADLLGGRCERCGYDKNRAVLHFHHYRHKNFNISWAIANFTNRQVEEILVPEIKHNCMLLCANCHREVHDIWLRSSLALKKPESFTERFI